MGEAITIQLNCEKVASPHDSGEGLAVVVCFGHKDADSCVKNKLQSFKDNTGRV